MRICYLGNTASIHTLRWANYFAEHRWGVDLITWRPPARGVKIHQNIKVHRILLPPHHLARYGALLEVVRMMKAIHPNIVHAHYLSHFGILAGLYSRLSGFRPIVLTAWGSDVLKDINGWQRWTGRHLVKQAVRRADCITCDGEHMIAELVKLGAAPEKVKLVYFGTDTENFKPGQKSRQLRGKLGLADSPVIISLRNLKPVYDVESLVKSIPLVLEAVPEAKFIIASDGEQRKHLQNLATKLGATDSVRFVGGLSSDELPRYLTSSDIYVSTALSDAGLAASTAEAMACGLPVVITDFGDNRRWVKDGVNGFVVPLRNHEALASKLIYLLQNKDKRIQFGQANRRVIAERNNRGKEMEKMEQLYNKLIERYRQ